MDDIELRKWAIDLAAKNFPPDQVIDAADAILKFLNSQPACEDF